jgi:DNA-binding NarL/FixJ family response regulator
VLFRQGLKSLLLLLQSDIEVIGEVHKADDLHTAVSENSCDILLLDLEMDRWMMDDIAQLSRLTRVIVVTASESAENGVRALRLGARAIVQKRFAIETLMTAIHAVAEGLVWMPPAVQPQFATQEGPAS